MASIKLTGDTSGEITIAAPAVAGTNTLTLPASTGTIITDTAPKVGNVLQVVQGTSSSQANTSSTSYVATGLTASITPSSTSSKILVLVSTNTINTNVSAQNYLTIYRNGTTNLGGGLDTALNHYQVGSASGSWHWVPAILSYLDSPSTTSSTEYKLYFKVSTGSGYVMNSTMLSTITLLEVAG